MTIAAIGRATQFQLSDGATPPAWTTIAEIFSVGGPSVKRDTPDVTNMDSVDSIREFLAGSLDEGEISLNMNFVLDATQKNMRDNIGAAALPDCIRTYRISWPNWGASSQAATVVLTTWTAAAHGLQTGQPVTFRNVGGALPVEIAAGVVYFTRRTGANTFTIHPTNADAVAGANAISCAGPGTGTHYAEGGSWCNFTAAITELTPTSPHEDKMTATATMKVTAAITWP
jgi:hypothetical protein